MIDLGLPDGSGHDIQETIARKENPPPVIFVSADDQAETAVQVALLNNKGLQASYAQIGLSAAEAWQQSTPENPVVSIGLLGIGAPEVAPELLAEDEAELTAAAIAEIDHLGEHGGDEIALLTDDADAAIAELEKGAAWDEDEDDGEVKFDLESGLAMADDELAQLVSDTPVLEDGDQGAAGEDPASDD